MGFIRTIRHIRAALLIAGSASCIYACGGSDGAEEEDFEGLMTQRAENLKIIESENGRLSHRFQTALMETYEYDREPFREFRKGIYVETFSDSSGTVETTLVGDYAINYINRQLWEVKGNVVATNADGQKLETQQLFWNQRTGRIYSNVDSKLTQGSDVIIGVGFESDEQFIDWEFRRPRGTVEVDTSQTEGSGGEEFEEGEFSVTVTDEFGNEIPATPVQAEADNEDQGHSAEGDVTQPDQSIQEAPAAPASQGRRMRERPGIGTAEPAAVGTPGLSSETITREAESVPVPAALEQIAAEEREPDGQEE